MEYRIDEQYRRADIIIDAVCKVGGVSGLDFIFKKKSFRMNIIRGVAFYLSWEYGVHARNMAALSLRSRCNVINQSKRYRWYLRTGDPTSVELYQRAKVVIENELLERK